MKGHKGFQKGHSMYKGCEKGWIKRGQKLSEETKKRMSLARKGKPQPWHKGIKHTTEWRKHMSDLMRGENHWNWQGGKETANNVVRKSLEYKLWREGVFERDNYTCRECGKIQGWDKLNKRHIDIQADHIKSFTKYPELRFDIDNGRTLCTDCHVETPTWGNNQYYLNG